MTQSGDARDAGQSGQLETAVIAPRSLNTAIHAVSGWSGSRLIVSCGDVGLANDYLCYLHEPPAHSSGTNLPELVSPDALLEKINRGAVRPAQIVLFIDHRVSGNLLSVFAGLSQLASRVPVSCLIVLPSLLNHLSPGHEVGLQALLSQLGDLFRNADGPKATMLSESIAESDPTDPSEIEATTRRPEKSRLIILRTGYVLSPSSATTKRLLWLRRLRVFVGPQLSTTFVAGEKLFSSINAEFERTEQEPHASQSDVTSSYCGTEEPPQNHRRNLHSYDSRPSSARSRSLTSEAGCCSGSTHIRQLTVLGVRRSWRAAILEQWPESIPGRIEKLATTLFAWVGISWLTFLFIRLLIALIPSLRQVHFDTLKPRSIREIISLYNRHNCGDVQLAGYNNGVNHFGWKFPEKTVVLTTGLPGKTQLSDISMLNLEAHLRTSAMGDKSDSSSANSDVPAGTHFTVDAGLTLKHCIQELNRLDREFYVVPNYSWISMGTLFFVPVHGSGSHVSTLGDTIEDVLLYDGETEEFILTRRGDRFFRDAMYDTSRRRLLLRLTLRVKPKSVYSVRPETLTNPSAEDVLRVFEDPEASNVEIRKNRAASNLIDIRRYYVDSPSVVTGALEMPRDSIGRVWDRLEETPVVSTLFHWFVRRFAFHVELILRPDEFVVFWEHHQLLPISKIQLRQMLKDGMTNSACATENCICADLFMTRGNRDVFLKFINTHLPNVRFNPGKQSL